MTVYSQKTAGDVDTRPESRLREKFSKKSWSAGGQKECLYMCLFYKPGIRFTAIIGGGPGRPRECSLRLVWGCSGYRDWSREVSGKAAAPESVPRVLTCDRP